MLPEQQQRIMGYFIEEAKDHLNTIEQGLLNLQETLKDSEMINEVFRAAHSVKGGAAMLGISSIQKTAHRLEDYFKILKEEQAPIRIDQKLESLFLKVFDALAELLEQLQGPFGLTEDAANNIMAGVEPVFEELHHYLEHLVQVGGGTPAVPAPPQPAPQPVATPQISPLVVAFQNEVPARLRELLQLFKQAETVQTRQELQSVCSSLRETGHQFDLSNWCELIETARRAIACEDNTYRSLAPVLIKEIKQAQDLVLAGRALEVLPSQNLQALVPIAVEEVSVTGFESDFFDFDSATLTSEESEAPIVEVTPAASAASPTSSGLLEFPDLSGEIDYSLNEDLTSTSMRHPGPEVGMAELNSLADLFEGENLDLGGQWQEEEVIGNPAIAATQTSFEDFGDSNDFADLLFDDQAERPKTTSVGSSDDLASLFGDDLLLDETPAPRTVDVADEVDALLAGEDFSGELGDGASGASLDNLDELFGNLDGADLVDDDRPVAEVVSPAYDLSSFGGDLDFFETAEVGASEADLFDDSPLSVEGDDDPLSGWLSGEDSQEADSTEFQALSSQDADSLGLDWMMETSTSLETDESNSFAEESVGMDLEDLLVDVGNEPMSTSSEFDLDDALEAVVSEESTSSQISLAEAVDDPWGEESTDVSEQSEDVLGLFDLEETGGATSAEMDAVSSNDEFDLFGLEETEGASGSETDVLDSDGEFDLFDLEETEDVSSAGTDAVSSDSEFDLFGLEETEGAIGQETDVLDSDGEFGLFDLEATSGGEGHATEIDEDGLEDELGLFGLGDLAVEKTASATDASLFDEAFDLLVHPETNGPDGEGDLLFGLDSPVAEEPSESDELFETIASEPQTGLDALGFGDLSLDAESEQEFTATADFSDSLDELFDGDAALQEASALPDDLTLNLSADSEPAVISEASEDPGLDLDDLWVDSPSETQSVTTSDEDGLGLGDLWDDAPAASEGEAMDDLDDWFGNSTPDITRSPNGLDSWVGEEESLGLGFLDGNEGAVEAASDSQSEDLDLGLDFEEVTATTDDTSFTDSDLTDASGFDLNGLNLEAERFSEDLGLDALSFDSSESDSNEMGIAEAEADLDDFADLEALLDESEPLTPATDSMISVEANDAEGDDFADLEALLGESEPSSPLTSPPSAAILEDDFADLEALLGDSGVTAPAPVVASSGPISGFNETPSRSRSGDEDFDDLEKLLEDADKTMGGPPTLKSRAQMPQGRRKQTTIVDQTMRVPVKQLDNLSNLVGELVVNRNSLEQDQERLRQFLDNLLYQVQQLSDVGQRMRDLYERSLLESSLLATRHSYQNPGNNNTSHSTGASFDALEMDRFTGFHSLSQEMIELIVRVRESASDIEFIVDETDQVTRNFRQVTTQLQEGLTRARMVPFSQTADRLPRGVRDNAIEYGKQAELIIEGRETLIDKMILEKLIDPLTHLVNNAVAHGIERPDVRQRAGKSGAGRITVRAFYQGNQTVISVSDDGAGIDPERIKAKAIEKGLITAGEAKTMSRLDVYDILFLPGFSGADQVTKIAGRGVGMDVVRTNLNEIRGTISIDSTIGKGTTFTIRLPLTLSISKALCCISNRARIAFPMDGVEDMLDVPRERIQTNAEGQSCILWREMLLPFQSLSDVLKYNRYLGRGSVYGGNQEDDIVSIVVLRSAGNFIALQVDQVLGEQEIVIKQLEGPVPKPIGIAGATVLGDGRIMPIADVLELIDLVQGRIRHEPGKIWQSDQADDLVPAEPPVAKTEPMVLIVDDSITVRELLSMTFNKVGYRVEQARDGQEAWEKLRSGLPCDMVFCDIEMPRMDGLELLSRIQKDPTLNHLPIAMLTSRGADRHRQMAIQLGARGYFTKPYLEEALLDAAQRMLKGEILVTAG